MAEAVKVIVRCRPMNEREKGLKCGTVVDIDGQMARCSITNPDDRNAPPKTFTFDGAYDTASSTEQIYADIGFPLVEVSFLLFSSCRGSNISNAYSSCCHVQTLCTLSRLKIIVDLNLS